MDAAAGTVRVVRAGFVSLGVGGTTRREDLLRLEDGDRSLESRWIQGDPPRCILEDVSPGVTAEPATEAQVIAAAGPEAPADALPAPVGPGGATAPSKPPVLREVTVTEAGFRYSLPGASWKEEVVPPPLSDGGVRVVARASSKVHAADVRIEYDPGTPASPLPSSVPPLPPMGLRPRHPRPLSSPACAPSCPTSPSSSRAPTSTACPAPGGCWWSARCAARRSAR